MNLCVLYCVARAHIYDLYFACFRAYVKSFVQWPPCSTCKLSLIHRCKFFDDFGRVFRGAGRCKDVCQVIDPNWSNFLIHIDQEELFVTKGQLHLSLAITWHAHACGGSTILDVKDNYTINRGRQQVLWVLRYIDWCASALHIELSSPNTLEGIVHGNFSIVTAREKQIPIIIVEYLADRTWMARHVVGLHWRVSFRCHIIFFI